jgi:hypothetical protein
MQHIVHTDTTGLRVLWDDIKKCYCFEDSSDGRLLGFTITMQAGDPKADGFTGPTIEALLSIAQHRIQVYNYGDWKCIENSLAITHIQVAMKSLFQRFRRLTGI